MRARLRIDGARVRHWRHVRVLSQAELARAAGLSVHTVWEIEVSKAHLCRPSTIRALATALGVEAQELVDVRDRAPHGSRRGCSSIAIHCKEPRQRGTIAHPHGADVARSRFPAGRDDHRNP